MKLAILAGAALLCAAPAVDAATYFRTSPSTILLPAGNTDTTIVEANVAAGTYQVQAVAIAQNAVDQFNAVFCDILYSTVNSPNNPPVASDTLTTGIGGGQTYVGGVHMVGAVKLTTAGTISLGCRQNNGTVNQLINVGSQLLIVTAPALK